jgi:hypothetical protein
MRKATFTITIPHLYLPKSALSKEINLHIITLRFNKLHGTLQMNSSNFLILYGHLKRPLANSSLTG